MGAKIELTEIEQKIFDKIEKSYVNRGYAVFNEEMVKKIIKMANTDGDGKKRVVRMRDNKTFLVPIEDVFLNGLKESELDRYPVENNLKRERNENVRK